MRSRVDASKNMLSREEVFENVSTGADKKANTRELVRARGGLLERVQRGVALEALGESSYSFGTEVVGSQTASTRAESGAEREACQWALTRKRTVWGSGALEVGDLRLLEDGSECGGTLVSDVVAVETASEGQDGTVRK